MLLFVINIVFSGIGYTEGSAPVDIIVVVDEESDSDGMFKTEQTDVDKLNEEPTVDDPTVDESIVDESVVDEPTVDGPAVGEKTTCKISKYGCCPDDVHPAHGPDGLGCCAHSNFSCCPDNLTPARGPYGEGCDCKNGEYGCCPDDVTPAQGPNFRGCGCQFEEFGKAVFLLVRKL